MYIVNSGLFWTFIFHILLSSERVTASERNQYLDLEGRKESSLTVEVGLHPVVGTTRNFLSFINRTLYYLKNK